MMPIIAILSLCILTPLMFVILLGMKLIGLIMVAIALPFAKETERPPWPWSDKPRTYPGWTYVALPGWAQWWWGSDKYGARGNWFWPSLYPNTRSFIAQYRWLAIRNGNSNAQRYPLFKYAVKTCEIDWLGTPFINDNTGKTGCHLTWNVNHPWRSGFQLLLRYGKSEWGLWIRIGYKQRPIENPHGARFGILLCHPFKRIPKPA